MSNSPLYFWKNKSVLKEEFCVFHYPYCLKNKIINHSLFRKVCFQHEVCHFYYANLNINKSISVECTLKTNWGLNIIF